MDSVFVGKKGILLKWKSLEYDCAFNMLFYFCRMANFSVGGHEGQDGGEYWGPSDGSLRHFAKKAADISLPGTGGSSSRSLFIFSEENFIRKYAKIIIEWGYPFYWTVVPTNQSILLPGFCPVCGIILQSIYTK